MIDAELVREIEPQLECAYQEHMDSIGDKRPISPIATLARAADTEPDPIEYGEVLRDKHEGHVTAIAEELGVDLRPVLASTFFVNLLTEDNLPHYTSRIHSKVFASPALMTFTNEWTAEEDTHGRLMLDYALFAGIIGTHDARLIEVADYEAGRVSQLRAGTEINPASLQDAFAYLPLQELLTKDAHNASRWLMGQAGAIVMNPIIGDEQNHYEFYRKAFEAALEADPDGSLVSMANLYKLRGNGHFEMPGRQGIPNFENHAAVIGLSGIFDLETIARAKQTIVKKTGVETVQPTTDEGKQAQAKILALTSAEAVAEQAETMESFRDSKPTTLDNGLLPFVLGKTVDFTYSGAPGHERITGLQAVAV